MKTKMKIPVLILLMGLGLMACQKEKRLDDGVADVYVKTILIDGQPAYALAHYLLGYSGISSVTVYNPDATTEQLSSLDNSNTLFYSEPSLSSYSLTMPSTGTYSYKVRFDDGVEKTFTDQVSGTFLLPPTITTIVKTEDNARVKLVWGPLTGAEYYRFSISKNGTTVYTSQIFALVDNTANTIEVPITVIPSYASGTYTFELAAYKYQSLADGKIQSMSTTTANVDL